MVYVSYNALSGWALLQPLQRLLADHAATSTDPIETRIQRAVAFADRVRNAGARYFEANQTVLTRLDSIKESSSNYLAHEYLVNDFAPAYHADVVREFSEAKLSFVCSADIRHHVDALNFDPPQLELLADIADPVLRETIRDFILARRFRQDIFVRGLVPLDAQQAKARWLDARFVLKMKRSEVPSVVLGPVGEVTLVPEVYAPILDALASGPRSVAQLAADRPSGRSDWTGCARRLRYWWGWKPCAMPRAIGPAHRAHPCVQLPEPGARPAQRVERLARLAGYRKRRGDRRRATVVPARALSKRKDIAEYVWELLQARACG